MAIIEQDPGRYIKKHQEDKYHPRIHGVKILECPVKRRTPSPPPPPPPPKPAPVLNIRPPAEIESTPVLAVATIGALPNFDKSSYHNPDQYKSDKIMKFCYFQLSSIAEISTKRVGHVMRERTCPRSRVLVVQLPRRRRLLLHHHQSYPTLRWNWILTKSKFHRITKYLLAPWQRSASWITDCAWVGGWLDDRRCRGQQVGMDEARW